MSEHAAVLAATKKGSARCPSCWRRGPVRPPRSDSAWGPAVGLLHEDVRFETVELRFRPGDLFVFYTDGITEAEDPGGSEFGQARLVATVRGLVDRPAEAVVSGVHDAVDAFRRPGPRGDDATVIVVRVPTSA